jgi:hypothetical protein
MPDFDFAIYGSSLLAGLLAGLLVREHGRKVVRIGRPPSPQRLPRDLELAFLLSARPETWRLLRAAEAETRRLLASVGATAAAVETETIVLADTADTAAALDHVGHLAHGLGHQVRALPSGWGFRRIALLQQDFAQARISAWLTALGIESRDDGPVEANQTVLADDTAILDLLAEEQRPALLAVQPMLSTLVAAPRPVAAPLLLYPDRGVALLRRPGNAVLALVSGERDVDARLASALPGPFPMKRLAAARFRRLVAADGAPVIRLGYGPKPTLIGGFAGTAPFFAPLLARHLAGAARADEIAWVASHGVDDRRTRVAALAPEGFA